MLRCSARLATRSSLGLFPLYGHVHSLKEANAATAAAAAAPGIAKVESHLVVSP